MDYQLESVDLRRTVDCMEGSNGANALKRVDLSKLSRKILPIVMFYYSAFSRVIIG